MMAWTGVLAVVVVSNGLGGGSCCKQSRLDVLLRHGGEDKMNQGSLPCF